ncbi:hypothetical protein JHW43_006726 [Diplocarpon mali]|nr:hypothetical protein JHW43_006726 [Diplocarpon mali]
MLSRGHIDIPVLSPAQEVHERGKPTGLWQRGSHGEHGTAAVPARHTATRVRDGVGARIHGDGFSRRSAHDRGSIPARGPGCSQGISGRGPAGCGMRMGIGSDPDRAGSLRRLDAARRCIPRSLDCQLCGIMPSAEPGLQIILLPRPHEGVPDRSQLDPPAAVVRRAPCEPPSLVPRSQRGACADGFPTRFVYRSLKTSPLPPPVRAPAGQTPSPAPGPPHTPSTNPSDPARPLRGLVRASQEGEPVPIQIQSRMLDSPDRAPVGVSRIAARRLLPGWPCRSGTAQK